MRRRSAGAATARSPAPINAQVDGSGTGVKSRNRLSPLSAKLKLPPAVPFAKPLVTRWNWLALKPTMGVAYVANIQE